MNSYVSCIAETGGIGSAGVGLGIAKGHCTSHFSPPCTSAQMGKLVMADHAVHGIDSGLLHKHAICYQAFPEMQIPQQIRKLSSLPHGESLQQ